MIRLSSDNDNSSDIGSVVLEKEPGFKASTFISSYINQ